MGGRGYKPKMGRKSKGPRPKAIITPEKRRRMVLSRLKDVGREVLSQLKANGLTRRGNPLHGITWLVDYDPDTNETGTLTALVYSGGGYTMSVIVTFNDAYDIWVSVDDGIVDDGIARYFDNPFWVGEFVAGIVFALKSV